MSRLNTGYLPGPNGDLHLSIFAPDAGLACSNWIIHAPAFAEEMNKSRAMVARQARVFAAAGHVVVVPDLSGSGDSAGQLGEASWDAWLADLASVAGWARECGAERLTLWGLRLGCLLVTELASTLREPPEQLLLWQPVHQGKQHMTQFLRLLVASAMTSGSASSLAKMREKLTQGESVEVAGYALPGRLYVDIEDKALSAMAIPLGCRVGLLEVAANDSPHISPVSFRLLEQWSSKGTPCDGTAVKGAPFWMTQELASCEELIVATAEFLDAPENGAVGEVTMPPLLSSESADGSRSFVFDCQGEPLVGVLHRGDQKSSVGVLIVVGGPQYRVGSHRQFYYLARQLAAAGYPTLRFDYRGMGDSGGQLLGFEHVNDDICSAINALQHASPAIENVVLWGLCDAATASVFYAGDDSRVKGLILANPWVYSEQGAAQAYLRHYYLQRFFSPEFWIKVVSGRFDLRQSARSLGDKLGSVLRGSPRAGLSATLEISPGSLQPKPGTPSGTQTGHDLADRFAVGLEAFNGPVSLFISGNDLTASEFLDACRNNRSLRRSIERSAIEVVNFPGLDHTFSRSGWRKQAEEATVRALSQLRS